MALELRDLLEAGVHFGHQTRRWNPKMRKFIFAERAGIYILDLQKTLAQLQAARELLTSVLLRGQNVLFVCTKRPVRDIVQAEAQRCGAFYVTERWLGGLLTNFQTIRKNIRRLKELERGSEEGAFEFYTKKEQLLLERERQKLEKYLSGIKEMARLPGALYVVDAKKERIAILEANRLGIPVIAIADTNADPDLITVPIPGNDDAIRSVSLITKEIADAILEARAMVPEEALRAAAEEEVEAFTYSTDLGGAAEEAPERPARRRPRRKRRPKPEVIAAHRAGTGEPAGAEPGGEARVGSAPAAEPPPAPDAERGPEAAAREEAGGGSRE
jgi:small subunit ribosomal protein S2